MLTLQDNPKRTIVGVGDGASCSSRSKTRVNSRGSCQCFLETDVSDGVELDGRVPASVQTYCEMPRQSPGPIATTRTYSARWQYTVTASRDVTRRCLMAVPSANAGSEMMKASRSAAGRAGSLSRAVRRVASSTARRSAPTFFSAPARPMHRVFLCKTG